jgi:hypothetical protein
MIQENMTLELQYRLQGIFVGKNGIYIKLTSVRSGDLTIPSPERERVKMKGKIPC